MESKTAMANGISEMSSAKSVPNELVQWIDGAGEETEEVEAEVEPEEEEDFDQKVMQTVSVLNHSSSFLLRFGNNVQNLLVSHLERLTDVLHLMQVRNHARSKSVVSGLAVLLQALQDWRSQNQVLSSFFLDVHRDADYFLDHARALRLTLGPFRLPDLLAVTCLTAQTGPAVLRSCLRRGLSPDTPADFRHSWDGMTLTSDLAASLLDLYAKMAEGEAAADDTLRFGRLLARALPPSPNCWGSHRARVALDRLLAWARMTPHLAEELRQLSGRAMPRLEQACRARIRASLHRNWALPQGIQELDVPLQLKDYLDVDT